MKTGEGWIYAVVDVEMLSRVDVKWVSINGIEKTWTLLFEFKAAKQKIIYRDEINYGMMCGVDVTAMCMRGKIRIE